MNEKLIFSEETYSIIGICMEVHNNLGPGFLEVVYKEALEYEFHASEIPFVREQEYPVHYKDVILPHKFYADFVVFDKIILEVKAIRLLSREHEAQAINYLAVSKNRLALLVNFGATRLQHKRFIM